MEIESNTQNEIVVHLAELNKQIAIQNSLKHRFLIGIIYGVGFFFGSAILATIAFGIFGPWFGQIGWVNDSFQTGASLLR